MFFKLKPYNSICPVDFIKDIKKDDYGMTNEKTKAIRDEVLLWINERFLPQQKNYNSFEKCLYLFDKEVLVSTLGEYRQYLDNGLNHWIIYIHTLSEEFLFSFTNNEIEDNISSFNMTWYEFIRRVFCISYAVETVRSMKGCNIKELVDNIGDCYGDVYLDETSELLKNSEVEKSFSDKNKLREIIRNYLDNTEFPRVYEDPCMFDNGINDNDERMGFGCGSFGWEEKTISFIEISANNHKKKNIQNEKVLFVRDFLLNYLNDKILPEQKDVDIWDKCIFLFDKENLYHALIGYRDNLKGGEKHGFGYFHILTSILFNNFKLSEIVDLATSWGHLANIFVQRVIGICGVIEKVKCLENGGNLSDSNIKEIVESIGNNKVGNLNDELESIMLNIDIDNLWPDKDRLKKDVLNYLENSLTKDIY